MTTSHLEPIPTSRYPRPAARPEDSRLDTTRVRNAFGISPPDWRAGVAHCMPDISRRLMESAA